MYDIFVTTSGNGDLYYAYDLIRGHIGVVTTEGEFKDHVILSLGRGRFVDLTNPTGTSLNGNDYTFRVRILGVNDAVTLISKGQHHAEQRGGGLRSLRITTRRV